MVRVVRGKLGVWHAGWRCARNGSRHHAASQHLPPPSSQNPNKTSNPAVGLQEKADLPEALEDEFKGYAWIAARDTKVSISCIQLGDAAMPAMGWDLSLSGLLAALDPIQRPSSSQLLDYERVELLFVGASRDLTAELGECVVHE